MQDRSAARIAFVGAGSHSTASLYPNIAHIPQFDLVAVCDLDCDRARHAARVFGATEAYTDVGKMLDTVGPDGVCVCGSAEMHHQVGLEVLGRGIPLFVEKPPAPSVEACRELVRAAAATATFGMVGFMKRYAPSNVVARQFMQTEDFGALSSITLMHGAGPYDDVRRMLYFNGSHMIDLARFLAGEILTVHALIADHLPTAKAVAASFRFAGGAVGHLNMNSGGTWNDCFEQVYITGESCQVLLDGSRETRVMSPRGQFADGQGLELYGWSNSYYISGNMAGWSSGGHYTRGYWGELSRFSRAIVGEVSPAPTLEDGLAVLEIIDAIELSAASGEVVALS